MSAADHKMVFNGVNKGAKDGNPQDGKENSVDFFYDIICNLVHRVT